MMESRSLQSRMRRRREQDKKKAIWAKTEETATRIAVFIYFLFNIIKANIIIAIAVFERIELMPLQSKKTVSTQGI